MAQSMFDTGATKIQEDMNEGTIYGRCNIVIDFNASGLTINNSFWTNAQFEENVHFITVEMFSDAAMSTRIKTLMVTSSMLLAHVNNWYSTATMTHAYDLGTHNPTSGSLTLYNQKIFTAAPPISKRTWGIDIDPGASTNIYTKYTAWRKVSNGFGGFVLTNSDFTTDGNTRSRVFESPNAFICGGLPLLVLDHELVNPNSGTEYYRTGVRVSDSTLNPTLRVDIDINGSASKTSLGTDWFQNNNITFEQQFINRTGVSPNIEGTQANKNRFAFRLRFYESYTGMVTTLQQFFQAMMDLMDPSKYTEGYLLKGTDTFNGFSRTTDINGNTLTATRPNQNVTVYGSFIIESVIIDKEEKVYLGGNEEIVIGQYFSIAPEDTGHGSSGHMVYLPPLYMFDSNTLELTNSSYEYVAAPNHSQACQTSIKIRGETLTDSIPEYSVTNANLLKYVAKKVRLEIRNTFNSAILTGGDLIDGVNGDIIDNQLIDIDFDFGPHITNMWERQQFHLLFIAEDSAGNAINTFSWNPFVNDASDFEFPLATPPNGGEMLEILKTPGLSGNAVTSNFFKLKTTENTSARRKLKKVIFDVEKNGASVHSRTVNRYNTTTGALNTLSKDQWYNVTNYTIEEAVNIYDTNGTTQQFSNHELRVRVYGFDENGDDYFLEEKTMPLYYTRRKSFQFSGISIGDIGSLFLTHDDNSTWDLSKVRIHTNDGDGSAHYFKFYFGLSTNGGSSYTTITKTNAGTADTTNPLTADGFGGFYREFSGDDIISNNDLNNTFVSIYDNQNYKLNIKVEALDNLMNVLDSHEETYDVSKDYGREAADLSSNSSITVEGTGNTGARYIKTTFTKNPNTGRASFFRMDLYKTTISAANHLGSFFTTGTSNNTANVNRTEFIKATSYADFQTKLAANTNYEKVYLADLAGVGAFGDNTIKARLRPLDDAGTGMDFQDESYSYTGYKFIFGQGTAIFQEGQLGASYLLKVRVRSNSSDKTNDAYDYIVLTASSNGNEVTYTLPSNGNSAWYGTGTSQDFVNDENNNGLDIASLLTDRYASTSITCNLKAYAYGLASPNTTATLKSEINKFITVPAWDWTFATHSVTLPANDPNLGNRLEYSRLLVKGTASNATTNVAEKFRLRVWNDVNVLYAAAAAEDKKEFILQGSQGTTAEFSRYTDSVNADYLDISDIINGSRWQDNDVIWDLYAVRADGSTQVGNGKSGILTIPALDWDLHAASTTASLQNNTYNDRRIKVTVARTNLTDVIPKIRVRVRRAESAGGVNFNGSYSRQIVLTPTTLDVTGTTNSDLTEDFYFNFSDLTNTAGNPISMIDIYDTVKYDIHIQGAYINDNNVVVSFGDAAVTEVSALASWKMSTGNTSVALSTNTANSKSVDVNIEGLTQLAKTENGTRPDGFNITFTRSDTNTQSTSFISFGNANVDGNTPNNISIAGLYDTIATSNHTLTCEIVAVDGASELQTVSKTISMVPEPKIEIEFTTSMPGGPLVAPNGDEYIAIVFKPSITAGFLTSNETINLGLLLDGKTTTLALSGDVSNTWQYVTLPTTKNVNSDTSTVAATYALTIGASYNMNRGQSNNLVSGNNYNNTYDKIYHRFPKVLDTMAHNFDGDGNGRIVFSFEKSGGLDVNYLDNNSEWNFDITIEEQVVGTLDSTMLNQTKTTSSTAEHFNSNSIPLVSKIPLEANYSSNITMTLQENFDNKSSIGPNHPNPILLINNNNLNTSAPAFTNEYSGSPRNFQKNNVIMNDIANYPNTTVVPFDVSFSDVPGTYALSGKKVSFKVPIDFDNYFTNAEPYFSFGLVINHKDSSNVNRSTSGAYIQSDGTLYAESQVVQEKKDEIKQSSVYKVRDFTKEGEFYTFTFDLNIPDSAVDWLVTPSISPSRQINYALYVYVEDELMTYNADSKVVTGNSEGNTELVPNLTPRANFNDMSTWTLVNAITGTDDIFTKNNTLEVISISSNFVPTASDSSLQVDWSFDYELEDPYKKPYSGSKIQPSARFELRNVGSSTFRTSSSSGASSLNASTASNAINLTGFLNNNSYNPKEDLEIIIRPQTQIRSYTRGSSYIGSSTHSHINRELIITANYRDLIIPTFDELDADSSLNQDNVVGNTGFENKIYWFYNKEQLKNVTSVFDSSKEKIKIVRKIRQSEQVYDIGHSIILDMYGSDVARESHSADLWKISWTDNLDNVSDYTSQGLNSSLPYSFEYELIPCFAYYQGTNSADESIVEITDKKVSTFLIPDEFPIGNNGVISLTHNHNSEHSVELLWKHVYDEGVKTLRSIDAKIYFDIYWFFDETDEQKSLRDIVKPRNLKSRFYKERQVDANTWNFIDRVNYSYPQSETLDEEYDYSYIWNYDKMEDNYKINIAIITVIESPVIGDSLSQNIATSRGVSNTLNSVVNTSRKAKKAKMLPVKDLKRQSLRHIKRGLEFDISHIPNLDQVPISITRKKAKPRGSDKPYSSST